MLKQHSWVCAQGMHKKQSWAPEVSGSANISGGQKSRLKYEIQGEDKQTNKNGNKKGKKKNPKEKEQFEEPNLRACEPV